MTQTATDDSLAEIFAGIGSVVDGEVITTGAKHRVVNPGTAEVCAEVPLADQDVLDRALDAARRAQPAWAALPLAERQAAIGKMVDVLENDFAEVDAISSVERGHPGGGSEAFVGIVYGRHTATMDLPVQILQDDDVKIISLVHKPVGVVAAITPWNAPVLIMADKVFSALLAGNTVVGKPSPFTPLATLRLAQKWQEFLPPGVLNVVLGDDELGASLVSDRRIDMVSFTGSVAAGKKIAAACGANMTRFVAELGGNDPAIVLEDADPAKAAMAIYGNAMVIAGQGCMAIKRVLVHESIYDDFVEQIAGFAAMAEWGPGTSFPPLFTKPQYDRVVEIVEDALAGGAKAVTGGRPANGPGYHYPPTIITGAGPGTRIFDEEQFGPVLPIVPFSDVEEALRIANDTEFGLCSSVWSKDIDKAQAIADRIEAGASVVNGHIEISPLVPFGGWKDSGIGRAGGQAGLEAYTELKTVVTNKEKDKV